MSTINKLRAMVRFYDGCNESVNDLITGMAMAERVYDVCMACEYDISAHDLTLDEIQLLEHRWPAGATQKLNRRMARKYG